jgi:hypothetical protein
MSEAAVPAHVEQLTSRGSKGARGGGGRGGRGGGRGSRLGGNSNAAAAAAAAAAASIAAEAMAEIGAGRGDEDWTPADEGGVIDAGKKLGRCCARLWRRLAHESV